MTGYQNEKGLLNCPGACWESWGSGQAGLALLRELNGLPLFYPHPLSQALTLAGGVGPKPSQVKLTKGY